VTRFFQLVSDWTTAHPIAFTLILFVLGIIISIYSAEIKQFLHGWTKRTWRQFNRRQAEQNLALLRRVHNNSYELQLYVLGSLAHFARQAVLWNFIALVIVLGFLHQPYTSSVWGIFGGFVIGWATRLEQLIIGLRNFDRNVAALQNEIRKYTDPEAAHSDPHAAQGATPHAVAAAADEERNPRKGK
jgi:hypothetical protein